MTAGSVAAPGTHIVQFYEGGRFLQKPITSVVLLRTVRAALDAHAAELG